MYKILLGLLLITSFAFASDSDRDDEETTSKKVVIIEEQAVKQKVDLVFSCRVATDKAEAARMADSCDASELVSSTSDGDVLACCVGAKPPAVPRRGGMGGAAGPGR